MPGQDPRSVYITDGISSQEMANSQVQRNFRSPRKESGQLEREFSLLLLCTDDTFSLTAVEVDKRFEDPTYRAVGQLLQQQLDSIQQQFDQAKAKADKFAPRFELFALLEPVKGEKSAIHLPEYDDLDKQEARFKGSPVLDHVELEKLKRQWQETVELADHAEKIRKKEASLRKSLEQFGSARFQELVAKAEELAPLFREDWSLLRKQLGEEWTAAGVSVREVLIKSGQNEIATYAGAIGQARETLSATPSLAETQKLIGKLRALDSEWRRVTASSLVGTMERTEAVAEEIPNALSEVRKLEGVATALQQVVNPIQLRPTQLPGEVWSSFLETVADPEVLPLSKSLHARLANLKKFVNELKAALEFASTRPSLADPRMPGVKEKSWAEAPDTQLELPRTPRSIDDRINIHASLSLGDSTPMKSHAVFNVQQFGRHSLLAPSVILVRPTGTRTSFDRDFKFAPAVAWLHTYSPRHYERGFWSGFMRFTQAGAGLHTAFLDHDPDQEGEIGLGGAISFCKDRIVAGVGWNLMANSRSYFYVGSNLIPILQALGYQREGGAGKKP